MSYILEAIRRSEEERRRLVPGVATVHAAPKPRPLLGSRLGSRLGTVITLAGGTALAVVATTLAVQMWPDLQTTDVTIAADPPGDDAAQLAETATAVDASQPQAVADPTLPPPVVPRPRPAEAPPPPRPVETATSAPAAVPGEIAQAPPTSPDTSAERGQPRRPYSPPADLGQLSVPPQPTLSSDPAQVMAAPAHGGPGDRRSPPPQPAAEIVSAVALDDLPDPLQRTLPDIAITLHRYATGPAARMIRVNGRTAREGDVLAGGLGVAEITRTGVVFTIEEQRFYMDAFRVWQARSGS